MTRSLTRFATVALLMIAAVAALADGIFPQDNGPTKVDVSSYPPAIQKGYKLLQEDCGSCHSVARPLNTTMTPAQWRECATTAHARLADIPSADIPQILDFLIYDQTNRKDLDPKSFFQPPSPVGRG